MAGLCRILIAATLVVHLMVGCCAHHAHACDGRHSSSPVRETTTPEQSCSDDHDGHPEHSSQEHSHCQGEKCSVVLSANTTIAKPLVRFCALSAAMSLDEVSRSLGGCSHRRLFSDGLPTPPLPLYLAHQSLLI